MDIFRSCLQFLALNESDQRKYLDVILEKPVGLRLPEVEIITKKPLLVMAMIAQSRPYSSESFEKLRTESRDSILELEALLTVMLQLGVWNLFSINQSEREIASPYINVWGVCRKHCRALLAELDYPAGWPSLSFSFFLDRYTFIADEQHFSAFVR